jgi:pSer/pThr/pTyr-binding forkhead associated (FHA) protein
VIDWHIMVAAAMAFSIAIACQPTPKRLLRALIATGIAAAGSFALRLFMTPFEAIVLVGRSMNSSPAEMAKMNSWAVYSPSELIQNVSMAIVMGLVLGFVEYYGRDAWLRLALGRNEGRDYSLERPINRIGSAEAAEIALKGDPAVMPFHAQVVQSHGSYSVEAMAGSVSVNGQPVQSATLQGGDIVSIGQATLMFMQKSRPNRVPQMIPAPVPPSPIPNQPVPVAETVERRGPSLEWAGGLTKSLAPGNNILGRDPASVVSLLSDQAVSRRHAEIDLTPLGAIVRDAGSRNGTLINGAPLTFDHKLADGDVIQIGSTKLTYRSH